MAKKLSNNEQLKTVMVIVSSVDYDDEGIPFAVTETMRYDLEGPTELFFEHVENTKQIVHAEALGAVEKPEPEPLKVAVTVEAVRSILANFPSKCEVSLVSGTSVLPFVCVEFSPMLRQDGIKNVTDRMVSAGWKKHLFWMSTSELHISLSPLDRG